GFTTLNLNNQADTKGRLVVLDVNGDFATVTGLAPAQISFKATDCQLLNVRAGSGDDTFAVGNTFSNGFFPPPETHLDPGAGNDTVNVLATTGKLFVNGGQGDDAVNVGSLARTLATIQANVFFDGGPGANSLTLDDRGNPLARSFDIGGGAVEIVGVTIG